jgi:ABC-type transport system involved in multi-copper enzyme maturation permease subunit
VSAAIAALAIWLSATGLALGHNQQWKYWTAGNTYVLLAMPGIVGLALGVPVVTSEIEHQTHRVAWSQSITTSRWLSNKLLVGCAFTASLIALLTMLLTRWTHAVSLSTALNSGGFSGIRIQPTAFDLTGLVVVGYSVFAFF